METICIFQKTESQKWCSHTLVCEGENFKSLVCEGENFKHTQNTYKMLKMYHQGMCLKREV